MGGNKGSDQNSTGLKRRRSSSENLNGRSALSPNNHKIRSTSGDGQAQQRKVNAGDATPELDEEEPEQVPNIVAAILADSDGESDSSSSSSDDDGKPTQETQVPTQNLQTAAVARAKAPPSSSSSSNSSDSDSDSGLPDDELGEQDNVEDLALETATVEEEQTSQYNVLQGALLTRDALAKLLTTLPREVAAEAINRSFVRLAVQKVCQDGAGCVLAEVTGIQNCESYEVVGSEGQRWVIHSKLVCKRGVSTRDVKICVVSNHAVTEAEHDQWKKLAARTGVDTDMYTEDMVRKAEDIYKAKNFRFDERVVSEILRRKGDVEFDAQKESRMRFLVQCAMSQMDISDIRENDINELQHRYKDSLDRLNAQVAKSAGVQSGWFDKRPNLFSLKMINQKNCLRQVRDDRHALDYTLATETAATGLNPFQRRACRPLVAWDTKLTEAEGSEADPEPKEAPAAAAPQQTQASDNSSNLDAGQRMERVLRAHMGARHILASLSNS